MNIHLGYEVGTGKAVEIPLRHLAVTGQTQLSGKTTTLEALISRSGLRAVAFKTKRAEASFADVRTIPPYFRERADWQFVTSVLEAALRERVKFERGAIIRACKGTRTLADVHRNIQSAMPKARGINQEILERLNAYLEIVIPQIEQLPYAKELSLAPGLNVMDLRAYTTELQALVIRSVLEWAYERGDGVVTIIPEAWEFIPQQRGSPVLLACEELIRKGGAAKTFVWLDSQDIASVHKNVLRSVGVWLIGVQAERNEVKRALDHMPQAAPKPKPDDVMGLELGQFFVRFDKKLTKVYVQPAGWSNAHAAAIAVGDMGVEEVRGLLKSVEVKEDRVWREKYEQECERVKFLQDQVQDLTAAIDKLKREAKQKPEARTEKSEVRSQKAESLTPNAQPLAPGTDANGFYSAFKKRLLSDPQVLDVLAERREIEVRLIRPKLEVDGSSLKGQIAQLIVQGYFAEARNKTEVFRVGARKFNWANRTAPRVHEAVDDLHTLGFLIRDDNGGYLAVPEMKVRIIE